MALAHELLAGSSCAYYLALARACLLKEDLSKCEECLCEAVRIDFMVILSVHQGRMLSQKGEAGQTLRQTLPASCVWTWSPCFIST